VSKIISSWLAIKRKWSGSWRWSRIWRVWGKRV